MELVRETLARLESTGLSRTLTSERPGLDFSSNDYLGLANDAQIRAQLSEALAKGIPLGSTGSRLLRGTHPEHERTEESVARALNAPSALLFSSGYAANVGLLGAIGGEDTMFFSDSLNHASIIDGIRVSRSSYQVYPHGDLDELDRLLSSHPSRRPVIVTESVFSMDGDLAPVEELLQLARKHGAWLVLDETHATGVFTPRAWPPDVAFIAIHSAGKALGAMGAFVLSDRDTRQLLVHRARSFMFSTAPPPLSALHVRLALEAALSRPALGERCLANALQLRRRLGLADGAQIVPVFVPGNDNVLRASRALQRQGLDVRAIRSPTVPPGTERLRISVKAFHSREEIEALAQAIEEALAHG